VFLYYDIILAIELEVLNLYLDRSGIGGEIRSAIVVPKLGITRKAYIEIIEVSNVYSAKL